jgi:hypothetical protein
MRDLRRRGAIGVRLCHVLSEAPRTALLADLAGRNEERLEVSPGSAAVSETATALTLDDRVRLAHRLRYRDEDARVLDHALRSPCSRAEIEVRPPIRHQTLLARGYPDATFTEPPIQQRD